MEMISRYTSAVTDLLPPKQRDEIRAELHSLIMDMLEERTAMGEPEEQAIFRILQELGPPHAMADKYRDKPRYLIGPGLIDLYKVILRIVIIVTVIGISVAFALQFIIDFEAGPMDVAEYFASIFEGALQAFAWVTIVFAIIEFAQVNPASWHSSKKPWDPGKLPAPLHKNLLIKQSSSLIEIIMIVLVLGLFTYSIQYVGIMSKSDTEWNWNVISFLNIDYFSKYLPYIWGLALFGIVIACIKLIQRKWSYGTIALQALHAIAILVFICIAFSNVAIYNANFVEQLAQFNMIDSDPASFAKALDIWESVKSKLIPLSILITFIELAVLSYRAYRVYKYQRG